MTQRRVFELGGRLVGEGQTCFITMEAGPTHSGLDSAKRLCNAASEAKADAVKFQFVQPERLVADRSITIDYEILLDRHSGATRSVSEPLHDVLSRRYLPIEQWRELKRHCDSLGLTFFATASFMDSAETLAELGCDTIKIASVDVVNLPFIRDVAGLGMAMQIDTGSATIGEIEAAVDAIVQAGNDRIIIHHCPSGYPARLASINLRIIHTLRTLFPFPIAFSDHTPGWNMDIAALTLGANMLEKTITEDRTTRSIEHVFSLEPDQAGDFVDAMRDLEVALGAPRRHMGPEEKQKRLNLRRSAFLYAEVTQGQPLSDAIIVFRRPGHGLTPDRFEEIPKDARFRTDLPAGHRLGLKDLEW